MRKHIGPIFLVSGTAIGAGMIALPLVLAKLGVLVSTCLMLLIWAITYYSALVKIELNLEAGKGMTLGQLGQRYSGPIAKSIGIFSLKLLSYTALSAYIYGAADIAQKFMMDHFDYTYDFSIILICVGIILIFILLLPIHWTDYANRILFIGFLIAFGLLLIGLLGATNIKEIPLKPANAEFPTWKIAIPIIFTSYGFQMIVHTIANYCNNDKVRMKKIFFVGSLIPGIVYILWTFSVISSLYNKNYDFYQTMVSSQVEVGDMIVSLSKVAGSESVQLLCTFVSMLALVTSAIGFGLGMVDSWKEQLKKQMSKKVKNVLSVFLTVLPPFLVALVIPSAYITLLSFCGLLLVIIAILLPIYLLYRVKKDKKEFHYPILRFTFLRIIVFIFGFTLVIFEILNIIGVSISF